jgi:hypothetical protein
MMKSFKVYKTKFKEESRGTNLRGVCKNGRCNWQIMQVVDGFKQYLGTVDHILKAALLYDIVAI